MKIRKCRICGMPPNIYGVSGNPGLARFTCSYFLCHNNERYESLDAWNSANKPDKPSKKDREIARLTEIVDMYKSDLVKAAEKIAELTKKIDNLSVYTREREKSEAELCDLVELMKKENLEATEKIAELTNTIDTQKTYIKKVLERVAELEDENTNICNDYNNEVMGRSLDVINYTAKLDKLSSENVKLHNKLIAAVGCDEAFDE